MNSSQENNSAQQDNAGDPLLKIGVWVTAGYSLLCALTFVLAERLDLVFAVVSAGLFFVGSGLLALGLWNGIQRSRVEEVTLVGLAAITKSHVPARARNILWATIAVQLIVTTTFAALRPFTQQAFGILVPILGLGFAVLWGSRFGSFHPRNDP